MTTVSLNDSGRTIVLFNDSQNNKRMTLSSSILLGIGLACSVALLFKDLWVIEPYMVSFVCFLLLAVCNLKIG